MKHLPIVQKQIFNVSHVHGIKFIHTKSFKKLFNWRHTITASQINFRIVCDER